MSLRALADTYEVVQKQRLSWANRVRAIENDDDVSSAHYRVAMEMTDTFQVLERKTLRQLTKITQQHPVWPWLSTIRGIGPVLSGKLLALIGDIGNYETVSKLWRFAGYAVINGKAERPVKGEKLAYNKRLKTTCWLVGRAFIMSNGAYKDVYDKAKLRYQSTKQDTLLDDAPERGTVAWKTFIADAASKNSAVWTDAHVHNAAQRIMVKLFLSHLWEMWSKAVGLATNESGVGHRPEDFMEG